MGWNTVWGPTTASELRTVAGGNMFIDALNERNAILGAGGLTPFPAVEVDDNFQSAGTFAGAWQQRCLALCSSFVKVETWEGKPYLGTGTTPFTLFNSTTLFGVLGITGWPRKYPREFASAGSTQYTDGSAFANGHYARRLSDRVVYLRSGGAWVAQPYGTLPSVVTTTGTAQAGDYVTCDLFNTLRDAINLLRYTTVSGAWRAFGGGVDGTSVTEFDASWATAKSKAEASYAVGVGHAPGGVGVQLPPVSRSTGGYVGFSANYQAGLEMRRAWRRYTGSGLPAGSTIRVFVAAQATGVFNANGTGALNNQWHEAASATLPTLDTGYVGTNAVPAWCAQPAAVDGSSSQEGYQVVAAADLAECKFAHRPGV